MSSDSPATAIADLPCKLAKIESNAKNAEENNRATNFRKEYSKNLHLEISKLILKSHN